MQVTVQQLVSEGRLSFVNGGWCMHDEVGGEEGRVVPAACRPAAALSCAERTTHWQPS